MKQFIGALLCTTVVLGCGEEKVVTGSPPPQVNRTSKQEEAKEEKKDDLPPSVDFQETAFVESERSRDPFRSYARLFVDEARGEVSSQREVLLDQYSIDELQLVALIGRANPARAMLIDPTGLGHVVTRGQYLGRASVVQPTGGAGAAYEVNWRVDRIRDGDLVLVRDDPSNPEVPSATRVIQLRSDDLSASGSQRKEQGSAGLESELRAMQERLAAMAAAEAARTRSENAEENP